MLITKPLKNVERGVLTVTPGAKMPTTNEPNVILALSKKKSDTILDLSFVSIKNKFTTAEMDCQGGRRHEKMTTALTIALFILLGNSLVYAGQDNNPAGAIIKSQEIIEKEKNLREKISNGEKMYLKKVIVKGGASADKEKIKEILVPFKNHWISRNDIELIMDSIAADYKEKGVYDKLEKISYKINRSTLSIIIKEK